VYSTLKLQEHSKPIEMLVYVVDTLLLLLVDCVTETTEVDEFCSELDWDEIVPEEEVVIVVEWVVDVVTLIEELRWLTVVFKLVVVEYWDNVRVD
jgi:hypothetical protein